MVIPYVATQMHKHLEKHCIHVLCRLKHMKTGPHPAKKDRWFERGMRDVVNVKLEQPSVNAAGRRWCSVCNITYQLLSLLS